MLFQVDQPFTRCHIGNSHTLAQGFFGQLGNITLFAQPISPSDLQILFGLGPNTTPIASAVNTDIMVGHDGSEFVFDGKRGADICFCYNPKAEEGILVCKHLWQRSLLMISKIQDVSTQDMTHSATMMDGCRVFITTSPRRALLTCGGISMLIPLVYQLHHPLQAGGYHTLKPALKDPANVLMLLSLVMANNLEHMTAFAACGGFPLVAGLLQGEQVLNGVKHVRNAFFCLTCSNLR